MPLRSAVRAVKHGSLWGYRVLTYLAFAMALVFAAAVLLLRYWLLPNIDDYRERIVAAVQRTAHVNLQIGRIEGDWDGLRPRLLLKDLQLLDAEGNERLALAEVESTLAWLPLFLGEVRFESIELNHLSFEVRRDVARKISVAGFLVEGSGAGDSALGDWLLKQGRIVLSDSQITWVDETLGGMPLQLDNVDLRIEQFFHTHRFGLRATPPVDVGAPIDIRGDLRGASLAESKGWSGRLYLAIGYADLSALKQWIELPLRATQGTGSLQVWLTLTEGVPREIAGDVGLGNVVTKLGEGLPELKLNTLHGLLGWREAADRREFWARDLTFTTNEGAHLPPADVSYLRVQTPGSASVRSEVTFDALDLQPMVKLVDRLPLDQAIRARVAQLNPRGRLYDFHVSWQDTFSIEGQYSVRGQFRDLALSPSSPAPGFSRLSGTLKADQGGGAASLQVTDTVLDMPDVFVAPIPLTKLQSRLVWTMKKGLPDITIERFSMASRDLAGEVSGRYIAVKDAPGIIDLKGTLTRASGPEVWRYIPLTIAEPVRAWLKHAIVSTSGRDVHLTLKGDLSRFPWPSGDGVFEAVAALDDGILQFAPRWPRLEGLRGQIAFHGNRLEIRAQQGRVYGIKLNQIVAVVPDLGVHDPMLELNAEAEGPTIDVLRYLQDSPLRERVNAFASRWRLTGNGKLSLRLDLPLDHAIDTRVSGTLQFANNTVDLGDNWPLLEQASGQLTFTQDELAIRDAQARVAGAPARFTVVTLPGGAVKIQANGQADAAAIARVLDRPAAKQLNGATDWQLNASIFDRRSEFVLESSLVGLGSSLPQPFSKPPQERMPLKIERRDRGANQDLVTVAYGNVLSAQLVVERGAKSQVSRGEVIIGGSAPAPQRDGVWISGEVAHLDYEQWHEFLRQNDSGGGSSPIAGVALSAASVRAFARDFTDVEISATQRDGLWTAELDGPQIAGQLTWQSEGKGALVGRFSRLQLPASSAEIDSPDAAGRRGTDLPRIDFVAEDFRMGARNFGRLALVATPNGQDWRIERLDITNPDATASITGSWQAYAQNPRTQVNVKLDVQNLGRLFARLNLPKGIDGGKAKLEGPLSWSGPPYSLDPPTLSGGLNVTASSGRFVKLDPGIGKLLAVVSLQTLPKVATLDFRDIFSQGFAFEKIAFDADITRGVARTQNFKMDGPAAKVEMRGEVNLAAETQKLDVKIFPSLSESVALGTALVNPVIGLGALVVQKALKDPIGKMLAFEYAVAGTWAQPTVTNKKKRVPTEQQPAGRR